ncbi:MAG: tRNA pseudouridine(55) synthase TruB [Bacilli bacterium]|nr:tRNA pseudouridine(55) synthase TruB [Bacilli bacterium]
MNEIIVVDKPYNWTSRDVVNKISHKFNMRRVGHLGTLDPIATGVLIVLLGEAVKLTDLVINDNKEYIATAKIGIETDTLDITGNVLNTSSVLPTKKEIESVLKTFLGKSMQEVPLYSSVKVNGRRLYDYARNNISVELPKREIEIFSIELLEYNNDSFKFKVLVSKGTYIRSLIRDIGKKLNTYCTMSELRRTSQAGISIDNSYSLDDILNDNYKSLSFNDLLKDYPSVTVDEYLEKKIKNGRPLENRYEYDRFIYQNKEGKVLAIYDVSLDKTMVKPYKVFNL